MSRKSLSFAGAVACLAFFANTAQAQLEAVLVTSGVTSPTVAVSPPGDNSRLFLCEQNGRIRLLKNGVLQASDFLDINPISLGGGERGLLGLAFHPDYTNNGFVYVSYTDNSGASVVRRYTRDAANDDVADSASGVVVYGPLAQPFSNHNGGCIQFGGDGKLYLGLGDGGSGNDPSERAQNQTSPFGKMLRFDVDIPFPHIPADNPFVGGASGADDLTWSKGLRNPWRFSFDRETGDCWIGDVGQNAWEEIDFEPAGTSGLNYGWDCMEGFNCTGEGPAQNSCTCNATTLTDPVHVYNHGLGCSVTGGYRYRGSLMPNHVGRYFFADYCTSRIWSFEWNGTAIQNLVDHTSDLAIPGGENISSFGEDADGELYLCDQSGGQIWRLQGECVGATSNYCMTSPNSTGQGAIMNSLGSTSVSSSSFQLAITGASLNQPAIFYYGPNQVQQVFGNGFRCVGGSVYRLPVVMSDGFGDAFYDLDFSSPPVGSGPGMINAGSTWNFQYWYRDPLGGGAQFNLSDGLSADFCP